MNILALDTSGPVAGCAVMRDGVLIHSVIMNQGLTHSETIMPAVANAMEGSGLACGDIDVFVAVAGPGSFTGVRIGVCTVKGLAHAVNRPCAAVDALEALAMNVPYFSGLACPILDARRNQVYAAAFDVQAGEPRRVLEDAALDIDAYLEALPKDRELIFLGDGVALHEKHIVEALGARARIAPQNLRHLRAEAACLLAQRRPESWIEARLLRPIYLRKPQAERERAQRLRAEADA